MGKNRLDHKTRSELINEAVAYHIEHRQPFDVLMVKFNLNYQDSLNAIHEARKQIRENELFIENPEREIKGLDWQYNPEREIRNLQVPKY